MTKRSLLLSERSLLFLCLVPFSIYDCSPFVDLANTVWEGVLRVLCVIFPYVFCLDSNWVITLINSDGNKLLVYVLLYLPRLP